MPRAKCRSQRGISLVEALVALSVMAFGMLAYVGIQSGLRMNGDVAKQRAEAVRHAQEAIERWRAYSRVDADAVEPDDDYAELDTAPAEEIEGETMNTVYRLTRTVTDAAMGEDGVRDPAGRRVKTLTIDVAWEDRTGQTQRIRLATAIAGTPPELAGALSMPASGTPLLPVRGRHPAIPPEAVDIPGTRTSRFVPPQPPGGTVSWVFDNLSGIINSLCSTPDACVATTAFLLAGHVRFALTGAPPTGAEAEAPPSPAQAVQVVVDRSYPGVLAIACYEQLRAADVRYFCAVPVDPSEDPPPPRWAGHARLTGLDLAIDLDDADEARYRVCRYTSYRDHRKVGDVVDGDPPMRNDQHPLDYGGDQPEDREEGVAGPLTNQNFLVIRAGKAGVAFDCPDDEASTPLVDGTTWRHQPSG